MLPNIANWSLLYTAELLSFSVVLLFMLRSELRQPIIIWICSNVLAALGMLLPSTFIETRNTAEVSLLGVALSALSTLVPYFAANYRQRTTVPIASIFALVMIAGVISVLLPYGWLNTLIG